MHPADYVGLLASVFVFAISVPQLIKIIRSNNIEGVSIWTWSLILTTYAIWVGYSPRLESWSVGVNNFLAAGITASLTGYIFYVKSNQKILTTLIIAGMLLGGAALGYFTPTYILDVILIFSALIRLPQAWDSFLSWKHKTTTQVSLMTWLLSTAGSVFWTAYGIAVAKPILIITPGIAFCLALFITIFEYLNLKNHGVNVKDLIFKSNR